MGTEAASAVVMLHFTQKGEPVSVKEKDFITSKFCVHTVELHTYVHIVLCPLSIFDLQTTLSTYITQILAFSSFWRIPEEHK